MTLDSDDKANLKTVIDFEKNSLPDGPPWSVKVASSFSQDVKTQTRIIDGYHLLVSHLLAQIADTKDSKLAALAKVQQAEGLEE